MSIKKDLLKEIDKKAQKIRDKRVEAASNKTLENAVFDFFRNIEDSRGPENKAYDPYLFGKAKNSLEERIRGYDARAKISIEFNVVDFSAPPPDMDWYYQQQVRGATIWWSQSYILKNNVSPSYYIDVSQMLFI